ncbi:MAG: FprA family A-type flavoprotein [Firmicutes bacterium]|nr:FprA family A-type flavoprotein [Bacillota bacterium]
MNITKDIIYIGVNDHDVDLFEGQYIVPDGMAYNSYLVKGEKTAVMDTVDKHFRDQWLENLDKALEGAEPDYLIVQHMEPDHSANIAAFMEKYPKAVVCASKQAFNMMKNFFGTDFAGRNMTVGEGSVLDLGGHVLRFVAAPMVHWPEVVMTYDETEKVFFSADAFGKFGALDAPPDPEGWACEARRYYIGIVGKFGPQVQNLLKKAAGLDISVICPLHGPVLTEDLGYYIGLYDTWSSYRSEDKGVTIAYTSVYGNTKQAAELLAEKLEAKGVEAHVSDLARDDMAEVVEDAFRYDRIVLATTTYAGDIFPFMKTFIDHLTERNFQNRTVAFIENGSWAPVAAKKMRTMLEGCKDLTFAETTVTVTSALNEKSRAAIEALAEELASL